MGTHSLVDQSPEMKTPERLVLPCPSSWISWTSYWIGLVLAVDPAQLQAVALGSAGFSALLAGAGVFFASVIAIQRHMRLSLLANSFGSPHQLVTSGPFRFSRNPIYVAFLAPIASLAYFSAPIAAATAVVYIVAMNALIIRREEAHLNARFGDAFQAYMQRVPRWIA